MFELSNKLNLKVDENTRKNMVTFSILWSVTLSTKYRDVHEVSRLDQSLKKGTLGFPLIGSIGQDRQAKNSSISTRKHSSNCLILTGKKFLIQGGYQSWRMEQ